ncbi:MAG: kelch repeat-containing protein [Steroidobacteraceae bacterium]
MNLVISRGPMQVAVPNVVGDTQSSATTAITGAGLTLGTVSQGFSGTAAFGSIMSQSPAAGTAATSGSAVNLVVSSTFAALSVTMVSPRAGHTATLLNSGDVILMGGDDKFPSTGTTYGSAELYNPTANTFAAISASMTTARENFAAALLPNGQVLVTGGFNNNTPDLSSAELYDPVAGTFTALNAAMTSVRSAHTATLLQSGKVLITGGTDQTGNALNSAELYDPVAQTFTAITATMTTTRQGHTATMISDGTVLLTGGFDANKNNLNTAEIYDPVANSFTALSATMTSARALHRAALLANGQVLITGGGSGPEVLASLTVLNTAEVYDPTAKTFTGVVATLTVPRAGHTETLLPGGQILITGGASSTNGAALATAEQSGP